MKRFVIQNNLISENDVKQIQNSCKKLGIQFEEVVVIPFTKELPRFTLDENNIYYGSTTFINNVYEKLQPKGIFFDPDKFLMSNYVKQWGEHMLNDRPTFTTLKNLVNDPYEDSDEFFIRPDSDNKAFEGQVLEFRAIKKWQENLIQFDNVESLSNIPIMISEPFNIRKEWRNFIVNGKVVTSSKYRENFKLNKSATDRPTAMLEFVKERIKEYQPSTAFVMDVALCGEGYYIIECGCINSAGFYHADIDKIILALANT